LSLGGQNNALRNMLIAGNRAGTDASDCEVVGAGSSLVSLGYNLIATSGAGCVISADVGSNLLNIDPLLGPRGLSSGMPIQLPGPTGPAVNAVPPAQCTDARGFGVVADARGVRRPNGLSTSCDIGAAEIEFPLFADGFE
jgi:hypothetical protein